MARRRFAVRMTLLTLFFFSCTERSFGRGARPFPFFSQFFFFAKINVQSGFDPPPSRRVLFVAEQLNGSPYLLPSYGNIHTIGTIALPKGHLPLKARSSTILDFFFFFSPREQGVGYYPPFPSLLFSLFGENERFFPL